MLLVCATLLAVLGFTALLLAPAPRAHGQETGGAPFADPPGPGEGIDVSHHSGAIDWLRVADLGYDFVYVKASEGVDDPDPSFHEHWAQLGRLGLPRGAYHFYVTEDPPEEQAELFLSMLEVTDDDLVPVVDVEVVGHGTPADWPRNLARFLDLVEAEIGVRPMVYTSPNFWTAHLGDDFAALPIWVAEYGVDAPHLPSGLERYHLWQFEEDRRVEGVEKEVDVSRLHPELRLDDLRIGRLRQAGAASPEADAATSP
jgi:lysozyme